MAHVRILSHQGEPVPAPVIGLSSYLEATRSGVWDVEAVFLPRHYLDAVTAVGGTAVVLPPQPVDEAAIERLLDGLDGLLITGGLDVDPARYGQAPHPLTDAPRPDRDAWEEALLRAALRRDLPVLGICRGLQLLNVSLGGSLHQHLPEVIGSGRWTGEGGVFRENEALVEPDSLLGRSLDGDSRLRVLSYHHQAVDRLGDGLVVTARGDDGVVQAAELPGARFAVAVQWHPEMTPEDPRLLRAFVDAARRG